MASDAGEIFDEHGGDAMSIAELLVWELAATARLRAEVEARDELLRRLADEDTCLCEDCVVLKLQKIRDGE